ncbi:MAG: hypothetical protein M3065_12175 [Actinomycetota bacterium]|nr:hypothetical protein [Actinomycetota bacterium]
MGDISFTRRRVVVAMIAALCALLVLAFPALSRESGGHSGKRAISAYTAALNGLQTETQQALDSYMNHTSSSDPRYYSGGVWNATDGPPCWFCYDSAAVAAATLSRLQNKPSLAKVTIDTFNHAISMYQLPSGAIADTTGGTPDGIGTGFFGVNLGITYLEIKPVLSAATQASWSSALAKLASYLVTSGDTTWYVNGNDNLRYTEVEWLAWAVTHQQRFLTAYNNEWQFTIAPPQQRWTGFGLHMTRVATRADGSNGAGYLAESIFQQTPGFDPSYTMVQLDTATDLYVLTRDPRYLRLMNLEFNQLRPLVNSGWILNARGGSRKDDMVPFVTGAVTVLAASGDRPDLVGRVSSHMSFVEGAYRQLVDITSPNFYKGFESWLAIPLLDREWPQGMASPTSIAASQHSQGG